MNRRDFVKRAGAAILPVAILGPRLSAAIVANGVRATDHSMMSPISAVIYDQRYSDCRTFAEAFVRGGAAPFSVNGSSANSINGDSASLWYGALRTHLACHGGQVAGFTTDSDFGVSQSCGKELNLKLVYEGAHDCRASAIVTHRLRSGADIREVATVFTEGKACWPQRLARIVCVVPRAGSRIFSSMNEFTDRVTRNDVANRAKWAAAAVKMPRSSDHPGYLMSWLLAPEIRPSQSMQY
jgi:hypothetical protein